MLKSLPTDVLSMLDWPWAKIEPYYRDLEGRELRPDTVDAFLADWNAIHVRLHEMHQRLYVATTQNTADGQAATRFRRFLEQVYPAWEEHEQRLRERLLQSGVEPEDFWVPLRNMRAQVEIFSVENLALLTEEQKLEERYNRIIGAQTVEWDGREVTLLQLTPVLQSTDRAERERAWRLMSGRRLADREAITELWKELLDLRLRVAGNAGFDDYRSFRWRELLRFDYSPGDSARFHQAVEEVVVPALARIHENRRKLLGVQTLRPWDIQADPLGRSPLRPFSDASELEEITATIFHCVDPGLGEHFETMRRAGLLDLDNRKDKAPGGYCTTFAAAQLPFILMNAVGVQRDVETLLHESGHAFHLFERTHLPYFQQRTVPTEFAEVASMAMELLAAPYLARSEGGFYGEADAARARVEHLERMIYLWAHISSIDLFQHWIYEHPAEATDQSKLDRKWTEIRLRFVPGVDWSGLEDDLACQWQSILHIHTIPFYIIEYALAQLGAMQIWANALRDQAHALDQYRHALSLGATQPLPQLYEAAGARLAFDAAALHSAVELIEETISQLQPHSPES